MRFEVVIERCEGESPEHEVATFVGLLETLAKTIRDGTFWDGGTEWKAGTGPNPYDFATAQGVIVARALPEVSDG